LGTLIVRLLRCLGKSGRFTLIQVRGPYHASLKKMLGVYQVRIYKRIQRDGLARLVEEIEEMLQVSDVRLL
ncbi:hypothetical protein, partial [Guyparkeria sp. SCN-R1]|uniref:hypothetical protein n=1 Tax=Guyparkeria sp. SCN-R1 TaxID=2341113 RepID=UPI001959CB7D